MEIDVIYQTDAVSGLSRLEDNSIDCIVTSPPYWQLRDYGIDSIEWADGWVGQLGLEPTREKYLVHLLLIFDECKRVLKQEGTLWVNLGDTYNNSLKYNIKPCPQTLSRGNNRNFAYGKNLKSKTGAIAQKSLCNIPGRFADEMIAHGWTLRNEIIWHKPSCTPASVKDRFTVDFEKMFFFTQQQEYYFKQQFEPYAASTLGRYRYGFNAEESKTSVYCEKYGAPSGYLGVNPQGRNKRAVWRIPFEFSKELHYASYPSKLVETPIKAGCPPGGVILDPFMGSGITATVAKRLGMHYIGFEPNSDYIEICNRRLNNNLQ